MCGVGMEGGGGKKTRFKYNIKPNFKEINRKLAIASDLVLIAHARSRSLNSVADPGPLMLGVLDRWTPTVNVLHTLISQIRFHIELCPIEARLN